MFQRTSRALMCLMLASFALLAACGSTNGGNSTGSSSTTSAPLAADQSLIIPNVGIDDVATLDPAVSPDLNSADAQALIYTGLLGLNPKDLSLTADLATEVPTKANGDISADGLTYTFHIKPGIQFSNGDPLDANTMAFTLERGFATCLTGYQADAAYLYDVLGFHNRKTDPKTKLPVSLVGPGKGIEVTDPMTLKIRLDRPIAFFLYALTYPSSDALDPKVVNNTATTNTAQCNDTTWQSHAVGTGPFMLKEWIHKDHMTFVPNPHWYGAPTKITQITMPFIKDPATAYKAYKGNESDVDGFGGAVIESTDYQDAAALPNSQLQSSPYLAITYISGNYNVPPFNNPTVREAFALAIDRDSIAHDVLKDTVLSSDHIVPQGNPGYDQNLQTLDFNPQMAKQLMDSVYPDRSKVPPITLTYVLTGADSKNTMLRLQSDFQTYLGVNVSLNGEDFNKEVSDVFTGKVQFYQLAWIADYPDPQDWLSLQFEKGIPNNTSNFVNPQFDALCNKADLEPDQATRFSEYNQAEQLALSGEAWMPLYQLKNLYVVKPWVHGFNIDTGGITRSSVWANVYVTQH